ncbi:hypothetical protein BH10BDE1_BH10BDE1_14030 [soil metagenome]
MNRWITFLNSVTDRDQLWSPFLSLRPNKNETISLAHAGKIALYFGLSYGAVYDVLSILVKPDLNVLNLLLVPILAVPLYFCVFGVFFILPWNARARRLRDLVSASTARPT